MVLNYRRDKAKMRKLVKTIALVAAISAIYGGVQNTYTAYANETESGTAEETTAVIPEETTKNPEIILRYQRKVLFLKYLHLNLKQWF